MRIVRHTAAFVLISLLIVVIGSDSLQSADAKKGSGVSLSEISSSQVCGLSLCDTPMSMEEKIAAYLASQSEEVSFGFGGIIVEPWGVSLSGNGFAQVCDSEGCYVNVDYDVSGSYSFDIQDNNNVQGSGTAQITLTSVDEFCSGTQSYSVSFPVTGNYIPSGNLVELTIQNGNPSTFEFTQHCDYTNELDYDDYDDYDDDYDYGESPGHPCGTSHDEDCDPSLGPDDYDDHDDFGDEDPIFDETETLPTPFSFSHVLELQQGISDGGEFSVDTGDFWMGSDITSVGSKPSPDSDGDGVPDVNDGCPNDYGPASNNGCPDDETEPDWTDFNEGVDYYDDGDWSAAISAFERSLGVHPDDLETYQIIVDVYMTIGEWENALDYIDRGLAYTPNDEILLDARADAESQLIIRGGDDDYDDDDYEPLDKIVVHSHPHHFRFHMYLNYNKE